MGWFLNFYNTFNMEEKNEKTIFKNYKILGETTDSNDDYSVIETNALETIRWRNKNQIGKKIVRNVDNDEIYYIHP